MFETYGPFSLPLHNWDEIDKLYVQIRAAEEDLQYAIGIYIVAAESDSGGPVPWYVGRTIREFGSRLFEHFASEKFSGLATKGSLRIHLIALKNKGNFVTRKDATEKQKVIIIQQEQELICHCLALNSDLINKQRISRNQVWVPGFTDSGPAEGRSRAAQALAKLLKK